MSNNAPTTKRELIPWLTAKIAEYEEATRKLRTALYELGHDEESARIAALWDEYKASDVNSQTLAEREHMTAITLRAKFQAQFPNEYRSVTLRKHGKGQRKGVAALARAMQVYEHWKANGCPTLEAMGKEYGVTRERIRQMLSKTPWATEKREALAERTITRRASKVAEWEPGLWEVFKNHPEQFEEECHRRGIERLYALQTFRKLHPSEYAHYKTQERATRWRIPPPLLDEIFHRYKNEQPHLSIYKLAGEYGYPVMLVHQSLRRMYGDEMREVARRHWWKGVDASAPRGPRRAR